jgi:hypothetical protein
LRPGSLGLLGGIIAPCYYQEDAVDLDAFKQMVAKNPKGFLGRYGLGNKLIQEGGNLEEAVEHLTVAILDGP